MQRPFYAIAHRCNDLDEVRSALGAGANAIECDIRTSDTSHEFVVNHDHSMNPHLNPIGPYLDGLAKLAQEKPQLALVIFDVKTPDASRAARLRELIRTRLTDKVPVNVVLSVASFDGRSFFLPIKSGVRPREGYAIDEDNDPVRVSKFFADNGIANHGYGNGTFVAGYGPNIPGSVSDAVGLKWTENKIRLVYVWTLGAKTSMRNYLAMGVDGIFVNDVAALRAVLEESSSKTKVRLASRADNPFAASTLPAYILKVHTGTVDMAGTDADVTFELKGTDASVSTTIDAEATGLFERGQTNTVTLIGTDVGTVQELYLSQNGSGNGPDWWVDRVTVRKRGANIVVPFDFSQWVRPLPRRARRTPAIVRYELTIWTSRDTAGSGTDADVRFMISGTKGYIEKAFDGSPPGRFERDSSDKLFIDGVDIGQLKSMTVLNDGEGSAPDWHLARVFMKGAAIDANIHVGRWVGAGKKITIDV